MLLRNTNCSTGACLPGAVTPQSNQEAEFSCIWIQLYTSSFCIHNLHPLTEARAICNHFVYSFGGLRRTSGHLYIQLSLGPRPYRPIITQLDTLHVSSCWSRRVPHPFENVSGPVANTEPKTQPAWQHQKSYENAAPAQARTQSDSSFRISQAMTNGIWHGHCRTKHWRSMRGQAFPVGNALKEHSAFMPAIAESTFKKTCLEQC